MSHAARLPACSYPGAQYGPLADAELAATEADITALAAMGFSRRKAMEALAEAGGCVHLAVDWLFSACV